MVIALRRQSAASKHHGNRIEETACGIEHHGGPCTAVIAPRRRSEACKHLGHCGQEMEHSILTSW